MYCRSLILVRLHPNGTFYCLLQYLNAYLFQRFELNTISAHTRLAESFSVCLSQVLLIFNTKDIDRNSGRVGTDTNPIKFFSLAISIFNGVSSISDIWIRDDFSIIVFAVQEPQFTCRHQLQNETVERLHVGAFRLGLAGDVRFDLFLDVHTR